MRVSAGGGFFVHTEVTRSVVRAARPTTQEHNRLSASGFCPSVFHVCAVLCWLAGWCCVALAQACHALSSSTCWFCCRRGQQSEATAAANNSRPRRASRNEWVMMNTQGHICKVYIRETVCIMFMVCDTLRVSSSSHSLLLLLLVSRAAIIIITWLTRNV